MCGGFDGGGVSSMAAFNAPRSIMELPSPSAAMQAVVSDVGQQASPEIVLDSTR